VTIPPSFAPPLTGVFCSIACALKAHPRKLGHALRGIPRATIAGMDLRRASAEHDAQERYSRRTVTPCHRCGQARRYVALAAGEAWCVCDTCRERARAVTSVPLTAEAWLALTDAQRSLAGFVWRGIVDYAPVVPLDG
jgi:hypothetical protein